MAPVHALQPSFSGGEFAPSVQQRVDLAKYAAALKRARNGIVHPHGGYSNRPGFKFVAELKDSSKKARLVPFEFSSDQAYALEFGHLYVRFHTAGGTVLATAQNISGVTNANPAVVTYSGSDTYANGDEVVISGIVGAIGTYLNGRHFKVAGVDTTANTFQLQYLDGTNVNSTSMGSYTSGGTVAEVYTVTTTYTESELPDLKFAQSADVLYIVHPNHAPATLSRFADSPPDWRLAAFAYENGPFMLSNTTTANTLAVSNKAVGTGRTLTASVATFASGHVGSLWRIRHSMPGGADKQSFTATGDGTAIASGGTWRILTSGVWVGTIQVQKSTDGGSTWTLLREFVSYGGTEGPNHNTSGTDDGPFLVRVKCTAFTSGTIDVQLSTDPYDHTGIVKVTAFTDSTHVTVEVLTACGDTTATWDWAEGSWSDANGWPAAVGFIADRLTFAATDEEPQTDWMSKSSVYTDFGRSDPLEDDDGITVTLPSRKINGIKDLVPLDDMIALTSSGIATIGSVVGTALTPTTVDAKMRSEHGTNGTAPVVIGNRIIYPQPKGSVIRDLGYDLQSGGLSGDNLSIFANHLFTGYSIDALAYQQEPDSLVWALRSDGTLLSMTYMREQQVIAWTWHETDGKVESICCIPADTYDELWLVVKRGTKRFVERMAERLASTAATPDVQDSFYVDSGLSLDSPKAITGYTNAAQGVVTCVGHGFSNGDTIDISDIELVADGVDDDGNTTAHEELEDGELNGLRFIVANKTTDTFKLKDAETGAYINTAATGFGVYLSGGYARKVVTSVTGLWHLEGRKVAILANGNVLPQQTVTNGAVTLSPGASRVHVGLPYSSDFQTLPVELKLADGTMKDRKFSIPSVLIEFLNSGGGWIGTKKDDLDEIGDQRTDEPLGSPIQLVSGPFEYVLPGGYERAGSFFFQQRDPLPFTILSVTPRVEPGG